MKAWVTRNADFTALAVGIVLAAVPALVGTELGVVVDFAALMALGAVLTAEPKRAGAVASVPGVIVALVRAATTSMGSVLLVVLLSPLIVLVSAFLARMGSLLVTSGARAEEEAEAVPARPSGRRGMFDTKAQRGRFLVIIAVILFGGNTAFSAWSSRAVERKADDRVAEIRRALEGQSPAELFPKALGAIYRGGRDLVPGGPYRTVRPSERDIRATAEVSAGFEQRCIHVHLFSDGKLTTERSEGRC